jgi:hypothetical protein
MSNSEVGPLDRFITTRVPTLAGWGDDSLWRIRALGVVSRVYGIIAIGLLIGALAIGGGPPSLALSFMSLPFLVGSGVTASLQAWFKRLAGATTAHPITLSPEAKELVRTLMTHLAGKSLRWRGTDHSVIRIAHGRRSEDLLSPDAFSLLESAAHEANRIYGVLAGKGSSANATLARLEPAISCAADETMAEMLDLAARSERYPENGAQFGAQGKRRIDELKALADQVERLQATVDSAATDAPQVSHIQAVLKELHADAQAREELQQTVSTTETEAPQVTVAYRRILRREWPSSVVRLSKPAITEFRTRDDNNGDRSGCGGRSSDARAPRPVAGTLAR